VLTNIFDLRTDSECVLAFKGDHYVSLEELVQHGTTNFKI